MHPQPTTFSPPSHSLRNEMSRVLADSPAGKKGRYDASPSKGFVQVGDVTYIDCPQTFQILRSYTLSSFHVWTGRFRLCWEGFSFPNTSNTPAHPIILFWSSIHTRISLQVIKQCWCFFPNDACTYMAFCVQP